MIVTQSAYGLPEEPWATARALSGFKKSLKVEEKAAELIAEGFKVAQGEPTVVRTYAFHGSMSYQRDRRYLVTQVFHTPWSSESVSALVKIALNGTAVVSLVDLSVRTEDEQEVVQP